MVVKRGSYGYCSYLNFGNCSRAPNNQDISQPSSYLEKLKCVLTDVESVASSMNTERKVNYLGITFVIDCRAGHHIISD